MKKIVLLIVLTPCLAPAQDFTEKWNGILSVQGMELSLVFHISREDSLYGTQFDSPDQKAFGILASATNFKNTTFNHGFAQSTGNYGRATSADFANDMTAAVTVKEFPGMNQLFQTCKTGAVDEYATIEQTIDPLVLEEISDWVIKQTK